MPDGVHCAANQLTVLTIFFSVINFPFWNHVWDFPFIFLFKSESSLIILRLIKPYSSNSINTNCYSSS